MKVLRFAGIMASLALAGGILAAPAIAQDKLRFVMISQAPDNDSAWNTVKNGIKIAAEEQGVTVEYRNPPSGDLADMARLIDQAAASNADGIFSTIADIDVLRGSITGAIKKGIPVITFNSGTFEQSKELGALLHIGQPEYIAGKVAGERVKASGGKHFLCVNHAIAIAVVAERCKGFAEGLGVELGDSMIDSGMDPTSVKTRVGAYLKTHPETDAILTVGPNGAEPVIQLLKELRLDGKVHFATFDLSPQIIAAVKDGTLEFAIDQQMYMQAWLAVGLMANYVRYGAILPFSIPTGPAIVTKDNVGPAEKFAGEYR